MIKLQDQQRQMMVASGGKNAFTESDQKIDEMEKEERMEQMRIEKRSQWSIQSLKLNDNNKWDFQVDYDFWFRNNNTNFLVQSQIFNKELKKIKKTRNY